MEGIYGAVLKQVLPRVTTLIWLDLSVDECVSNLLQRGQTGGGTNEQFEELLEYTRGYGGRVSTRCLCKILSEQTTSISKTGSGPLLPRRASPVGFPKQG